MQSSVGTAALVLGALLVCHPGFALDGEDLAGDAPDGSPLARPRGPGEQQQPSCRCRDPAATAFADTVSFAVAVFDPGASAMFPTPIPVGERLAVELVSARCEAPHAAGGIGAPTDFGINAPLAGVVHTYHLALTLVSSAAGRDYYIGNLAGGFYADPGGTFAFVRYGGIVSVDTAACTVTLSGHLVRP